MAVAGKLRSAHHSTTDYLGRKPFLALILITPEAYSKDFSSLLNTLEERL